MFLSQYFPFLKTREASAQNFRGWPIWQVMLPGGDRIICTYCLDGREPEWPLYDINHNIFRLDKKSKVVWQIRRHEEGKLNLDAMRFAAHKKLEAATVEPFMNLLVIRSDGSRRSNSMDGGPLKVDEWESGCLIRSNSLNGHDYDIDVETGIANNVSALKRRPW